MISPHAAPALIALVCAASILLMLVRPRGLAEVYWVGGGAVLLLALRLIPLRLAAHAVGQGTGVYLFLTGMMLLSALARQQGVFDWLAAVAVRGARGSATRLFTLVYAIGAAVTIFLSNDATAVVLTPAVLAAARQARARPLPYLFACALIANAASFVLPISNPANLVLFARSLPPLGVWLAAFALPSALAIAVTYGVLRVLFRQELSGELAGSLKAEATPVKLRAEGKLVLGGLAGVVVVLLCASALHAQLGPPTCLAAVVVVAAVWTQTRDNPLILLREVSWSTLALVAGLFVLVGAIESAGVLRLTGQALHWVQGRPAWAGVLLLGFAVGVGNNLVNNLPLGLLTGATLQEGHVHGLLGHAALIGVDLGPNLSVTGSLATILWLLALRREGLQVSFWGFLKVGLVAMPLALAAALVSLLVQNL